MYNNIFTIVQMLKIVYSENIEFPFIQDTYIAIGS